MTLSGQSFSYVTRKSTSEGKNKLGKKNGIKIKNLVRLQRTPLRKSNNMLQTRKIYFTKPYFS